MDPDVIFSPLRFRNLVVKNRILRANISGRLDNYDGSGTRARINWELKFARGGVGAIISSFVPIDLRGRIVPNYAAIDRDDRIPFWRELGRQVHEYDCRYIVQLAHGGRQRDVAGPESRTGLSSTNKPDPLHGFPCERMTTDQIGETIRAFANAARRVREAGLDGVEIHGANGYLFTQFLSPVTNDRTDDYGGSLENRARLLLETVRAIRAEVGPDFHLQVKISATDDHDAVFPWLPKGTTIDETVAVCRWLEEAGVDAIHVSRGDSFPHPNNPAGAFDVKEVVKTYDALLSNGSHTLRNYLAMRTPVINLFFKWRWDKSRTRIEGANLGNSRAVKQAVTIPVLCTGGFQTASVIRKAISGGACDAVTIARPLVANNDLVALFAQGLDRAPKPCTYCNKCLHNVLKNPIGCYEERRFASRDEMIAQIMSVFDPPPYAGDAP